MVNRATKAQKEVFAKMVELGCIICTAAACIHHCETGIGRRKDHDKVIPLCYDHHQGAEGIHTLGRRKWESIFGTEQSLMALARKLIE